METSSFYLNFIVAPKKESFKHLSNKNAPKIKLNQIKHELDLRKFAFGPNMAS